MNSIKVHLPPTIRMICALAVVFWNCGEGEIPVPEFYGAYFLSNGELIEAKDASEEKRLEMVGDRFSNKTGIKRLSSISLAANDYIVIYDKDASSLVSLLQLGKFKFVKELELGIWPNRQLYKTDMWILEKNVPMNIGPLKGQPDLYRMVPKTPLSDGVYAVYYNIESVMSSDKRLVLDFVVGKKYELITIINLREEGWRDKIEKMGEEAVEPLIDVVKDKDASSGDVRLMAATALTLIGSDQAVSVDPLIKIAASVDEDLSFRRQVIHALGSIGGRSVVEPLIALFKDKEPLIRRSVAFSLGRIGDKRAIEPLRVRLREDGDKIARLNVSFALFMMGEENQLESIITALKDKDWAMRNHAAFLLGEIGDRRAVEHLIEALKDKNDYVRMYAIWALADIGDKRAADHLIIAALKDKDDRVRVVAIAALADIGDKRAIEPLVSLKDEKDYIRVAAEEALKDLGWNP